MTKLIYTGVISLDGYHSDANGSFDWAAPDEEVHAFVNELERPIGTYLLGRRMYEVMGYWETALNVATIRSTPDYARDLAGGRQDRLLGHAGRRPRPPGPGSSGDFDPEAVRRLKDDAEADLSVGGPDLAARRSRPGWSTSPAVPGPVVVGGGTRFLPDDVRLDLELLDERRFAGGFVYLQYAV